MVRYDGFENVLMESEYVDDLRHGEERMYNI